MTSDASAQQPAVDARVARQGIDTAQPGSTRHIASESLFAGAREVLIDHHGQLYRLRRTSLGKLILTK